MTRDAIEILVLVFWILFNRLWSNYEHRQGRKDINEIRIYFNGEMEKKLKQAREEGIDYQKQVQQKQEDKKRL